MEDIISKAIEFGAAKHRGQLDDNKQDFFFTHSAIVGQILCHITSDPEIIAAGYLHDTLEDTDTTLDELIEYFGSQVGLLVKEVTKEGDKQTGYYFPNLRTREAILIKFADRLSNLSRMETWSEERQNHYLKKSKFWKSEPSK